MDKANLSGHRSAEMPTPPRSSGWVPRRPCAAASCACRRSRRKITGLGSGHEFGFFQGHSTLVQMNTVELCLPVMGLLPGPVLIYKDFPSMLN